ncbi:hypothetical protein BBJ28_00008119 [Nothophytophthora sp. Chile5]|nr:hypothetical protein BBJ28_00008119 [Nothophytophthora sp. Chile5]
MAMQVLRPRRLLSRLQLRNKTAATLTPARKLRSCLVAPRSVSLQHQQRFASSSSTPPDGEQQQDWPPAGSFQEISATFTKVRARKDVLRAYKDQGVFAPSSLGVLADWLMFYHLNRPQRTQLDVVEFLEGARQALETTMMAMHSREFADYADRDDAAPGILEPDYATAEMLQRSLEPVSFDAFKKFVRYSTSVGIRAEMQQMEVHSAHLLGVQYHRVPKLPTTNSSGDLILGVPMDERLTLSVLFDATEHVKVTLPDDADVDPKELVLRRNKSIWQFQSNVTTPEDIDWIVEPLHLTT